MPKANILRIGSYFIMCRIILMATLGILSSTSPSAESKQLNVCFSCNMFYETSAKGKVEFSLNVPNENMPNLSCENQNLGTCEVNETLNISSIQYSKEIGFHEHLLSTATPSPIVYTQNDFNCNFGKIRYLKCNCIDFDFSQDMTITHTQLGKADVKIGGFHKIPKFETTDLTVIPNSEITRINEKHFKMSVSDLCQIYNLTMKVKSQPECTNWKIKSKLATFPITNGNANIFSCQYNQTIATLTTSVENNPLVYFNLEFENESFNKSVAKELTLLTNLLKKKSEENITGSAQICAHGCNKCKIVKNFTCYSTIPKSLKVEERSSNIILILCVVAGIIFFGMCGIVLWFRHAKRTKSKNSDAKKIRSRVIQKTFSRISFQTIKNNTEEDPTYEVIKDFNHYDEPDINVTDVFFEEGTRSNQIN